jgi:hypothetical protein
MIAVAGRQAVPREVCPMGAQNARERFDVVTADSSLTFFAMSTVQSAYGKTAELAGYVDAHWNADGSIALAPPPEMQIEFKVESLHTGNELQDREMWKLIDSKRFPKVAGELRELRAGSARGRYAAAGQITLAGLARRYEGELSLDRDGRRLRLNGEVKVDVRDFGLRPVNLLVLSVAPVVRVRLHVVAAKAL